MNDSGGVATAAAARAATLAQPIKLSCEVEEALYEVRTKIYPRAVHGWFAGWRWSLVWFTQILF